VARACAGLLILLVTADAVASDPTHGIPCPIDAALLLSFAKPAARDRAKHEADDGPASCVALDGPMWFLVQRIGLHVYRTLVDAKNREALHWLRPELAKDRHTFAVNSLQVAALGGEDDQQIIETSTLGSSGDDYTHTYVYTFDRIGADLTPVATLFTGYDNQGHVEREADRLLYETTRALREEGGRTALVVRGQVRGTHALPSYVLANHPIIGTKIFRMDRGAWTESTR
jgi:hypothetical protein